MSGSLPDAEYSFNLDLIATAREVFGLRAAIELSAKIGLHLTADEIEALPEPDPFPEEKWEPPSNEITPDTLCRGRA